MSQQLSSAYLSRNEEGPYLLVKSWMGKSKHTAIRGMGGVVTTTITIAAGKAHC